MINSLETATYPIQLMRVYLHQSDFRLLEAKSIPSGKSELSLKVNSYVSENEIETHLNIKTIYHAKTEDFSGYELKFCILGIFKMGEIITKEVITQFSEEVAPALLLPYAREYNSDMARRGGFPMAIIPVFNTQTLLQGMREAQVISVKFITSDSAESLAQSHTTP